MFPIWELNLWDVCWIKLLIFEKIKNFSCSFFKKIWPPTFSVFLGSTRHEVYSGTVKKIRNLDFIWRKPDFKNRYGSRPNLEKIFFLLKWLMMSNHTRTPLTTLLLHYILHHIVYMIYYVVYIRSETRGPNFTCRWICLDVSTHNTQVGNGLPWWSPAWRPTVRHIENWKILSGP